MYDKTKVDLKRKTNEFQIQTVCTLQEMCNEEFMKYV